MKRMRKGIVVLIVAASGAIGVVGTGAAAQAQDTPAPAVVQGPAPQLLQSRPLHQRPPLRLSWPPRQHPAPPRQQQQHQLRPLLQSLPLHLQRVLQ